MTFTPDELLARLERLGSVACFRVAYSGGLDSHVLLHAMVQVRDRLSAPICAVHVNHGLSPDAGNWARHCRDNCGVLDVELTCIDIDAAAPQGESQEAWSRKQRYRALRALMDRDEVLLTAHHADDQAETVLLYLLRGSGPDGLAAMPAVKTFGPGRHARPLLDFDRAALHDYGRVRGLQWLDDESNQDRCFDRNFLRHDVLPVLRQRWPSLSGTLGRAARLQSESARLLEQLARMDREGCYDPASGTLDTDAVMALPASRQRNLLRYWLRLRGFAVPDSRRLEKIINEVLPAREDATPLVEWDNVQVRRYRGRLYAVTPLPSGPAGQPQYWDMEQPLVLPLGTLTFETAAGRGLRASVCRDGNIRVGFRRGGEVIRRAGRDCHQALKKLLQEHAVPPWLRPYIPLVFIDEELASVAGVWTAEDYAALPEEEALIIHWTESKNVFGSS